MFSLRNEKDARKEAMIDMDEFLIKYGNKIIPHQEDLVKTLYETASNGLEALDELFKDDGFGRTENFLDVAKGFLVDYYNMDPKDTDVEAEKLGREAIDYLGKHLDDFIKWER